MKNLLLFAGIIFAAQVGDPRRWLEARAAFVAYCAAFERRLPRERPPGCGPRPAAPRQAPPSDRPRRVPAAHGRRARRRARRRQPSASRPCSAPASFACLLGFAACRPPTRYGSSTSSSSTCSSIAALFVLRAAAGAVAVDVEDLTVAARLHRPAGAVPRARQATCRARARRRRARRRGGRCSRATRSRSSTSCSPRSPARRSSPTRSTRSRHGTRTRSWSRCRSSSSGSSAICSCCTGTTRAEEPENVLLGDVPILVTVAVWAIACARSCSSFTARGDSHPGRPSPGVRRRLSQPWRRSLRRGCDVIAASDTISAVSPARSARAGGRRLASPTRRDRRAASGRRAARCARRSAPARAVRVARSRC